MRQFVCGKKATEEIIKNKISYYFCYCTLDKKEELIKIGVDKSKIKIVESNFFFNKNLSDINHQNIAIELDEPKTISQQEAIKILKEQTKSLVLIVDSIEDVGNFGSILRTACAAGVSCVFIKNKNQVQLNEAVNKISMGSAYFMNICKVTNITNLIIELKDNGFWVVGSDLETKNSYDKFDYAAKTALVVGNESDGITSLVKKNCDSLVKIDMDYKIQSLNVAVATGILLFKIKEGNENH